MKQKQKTIKLNEYTFVNAEFYHEIIAKNNAVPLNYHKYKTHSVKIRNPKNREFLRKEYRITFYWYE